MNLWRELAKAHYEEFFSGLIGCCESRFEDLPPDYIERLERSIQAALKVLREHSIE